MREQRETHSTGVPGNKQMRDQRETHSTGVPGNKQMRDQREILCNSFYRRAWQQADCTVPHTGI